MTDSAASAPLIIGPEERASLAKLREVAAAKPVEVSHLLREVESAAGRRRHRDAMNAQTVVIPGPWQFFVVFTIETGHPAGTCRHMSLSIRRKDRVPSPAAVWMVAEELGFSGGLLACSAWLERLSDGGIAINVAQPLAVGPAATG